MRRPAPSSRLLINRNRSRARSRGIAPDAAKKLVNQPQLLTTRRKARRDFHIERRFVFYDFAAGKAKRLTNTPIEELEADFSPDGKMISFVRGNNLFVINAATGRETQLTSDGGEKILNGYLDWVYEEELYGRGNKRGYWWSPDSASIAFLRTDENPVPKFVLVDHISTDQKVENTDYPQSGDPNPFVKLATVNVKNRTVKFMDISKYKPEDFLISRVAWSPDSRVVVFQAQNREQTFLDLNAADRTTGKTQTLFRETSPAWVEAVDNPKFLKNGTAVWQSSRTGFKHLYLYDNNGNNSPD